MTFFFTRPRIKNAIRHVLQKATPAPLSPFERQMKGIILQAVDAVRSGVVQSTIRDLLEAGDIEGALRAIPWEQADDVLEGVQRIYRGSYEEGALRAERQLRRTLLGAQGLRFDLTNPHAVDWVRNRSTMLIREFGESSREGVRHILERSFTEGIAPAKTARMIRETGIGLTRRQAVAVENFMRRMEDAAEWIPDGIIQKRTARYAAKMLKRRAETIARTEIISASTHGQQELWRQAAQRQLLDPSRAVQEWIVSWDERLCLLCEPLDGETAPMGGTFPGGYSGPPLHPLCRCAVVLLPDGPRK
jgi:hypothetical protein